MDTLLWYWFAWLVVGIASCWAFSTVVQLKTVLEYQAGLLYRFGCFTGLTGPGLKLLVKAWSRLEVLDLREQLVTLPGQEVLTKDNAGVKLSLLVTYQVVDPVRAAHRSTDHTAALYAAVQAALRSAVCSRDLESVLAGRGELAAEVVETVAPQAELLGLKLVSLQLKDVMLPADLRKAFAETLKARQEAQAALERARGETAALRNLANAARMIEGNPALLELRVLQTMASTSGNTYVVGAAGAAGHLPRKPGAAASAPPAPED